MRSVLASKKFINVFLQPFILILVVGLVRADDPPEANTAVHSLFAEQAPSTKGGTAPPTTKAGEVSATGAFVFEMPIRVPPGRNGAAPILSLSYSSDGANEASAFGAGWSLPVSAISRSRRHGTPRIKNVNGNFAYEDSEGDFPNFERDGLELVVDPTAATNSVGVTYRDRVDRSTTQSIYHSEAPSLWMVREKNGLTHFYGNVPDKSVPEAVLRDELGVSQWLIVRSVDPFGNAIDYTYVAGEQRSDLTQLQLAPLLLRIEYGANLATGSLHNSSHFVVNSK